MKSYTLEVELPPSLGDIKTLINALDCYAIQFAGVPGFQSTGVILRDEFDATIGGALGQINWNWPFISIIWLPANMRRMGYGSEIRVN